MLTQYWIMYMILWYFCVENEDYDYSYYGDILDFGDSSDDYIIL